MAEEAFLKYLEESKLNEILIEGYAELYRKKPEFPVSYLIKWLKNHIQKQSNRSSNQKNVDECQKILNTYNEKKQQALKLQNEEKKRRIQLFANKDQQFKAKLDQTQYVQDLIVEWFPNYIQNYYSLTGCYIGKLTFPYKVLQEHDFAFEAELDTSATKIIRYLGCSESHKELLLGAILPSQTGRTYESFSLLEEQDAPQQQEDKDDSKPVAAKKKYLYFNDVLKAKNLHYFKYPRLGSFVSFPVKVKSCLSEAAFDKGLQDYKNYLVTVQEANKQYEQKLADAKAEYQQAFNKAENFQINEDDPSTQAQKDVLVEESKKLEQQLAEIQANPPNIPFVQFESRENFYTIGCDTLGQDRKLQEKQLDSIYEKIENLKNTWQQHQQNMVLEDIKIYMQDENSMESKKATYQQSQKTILLNAQSTGKQAFPDNEKQAQFTGSIYKCQKLIALMKQQICAKSLERYLKFSIHKFKQIIQIAYMLVGQSKQSINLTHTNTLDTRKVITQAKMNELIERLGTYELQRTHTKQVQAQYKISKLNQRLQVIDLESVGKYNIFLYGLINALKSITMARMQGREALNEAYENKVKAKQDRDAQILKFQQEKEKSLAAEKAELNQEEAETFNQQEWLQKYLSQNERPEPLQVEQKHQILDLD